MINCLICNEQSIELLNISSHPVFYKVNDSIIYKNQKQQIAFLYCYKCFHCQISKTPSDTIDSYKLLAFPNIHDDNYNDITKLLPDFNQTTSSKLFVTDYQLSVSSGICIDDFLDVDEKSNYEKIYFYKSFDKIYYIKDVLKKCKKLLTSTGEIIIVTSTANVVRDRKYDCISNEILSYFCTNSMKTLCEQFELTVNSVSTFTDNVVYRIGFKTQEIGSANDLILNLYKDIEDNIYDDKLYIIFNLRGLFYKSNLQKQLLKNNISRFEQNESTVIIGYGLSQNIINIINFCELTSNYIDYFLCFETDSNYYVPGTDIPIKNYWHLFNEDNYNHNCNFNKVILINFTNSHINDNVYNHFKSLYNTEFTVIDLKPI